MKSQKWIIVENIKRVTKVTEKENNMRTNYMMTVDDVMEELGVKRSKAYSILKQLNDELAKEAALWLVKKSGHSGNLEDTVKYS